MTRYFLIPILALLLVACDSKSSSNSSTTQSSGGVKKKLVVGFSQVGAESGWRTANTQSIQSEAAKRGIELVFSDAQGLPENQMKALRTFLSRKVDFIAFSPKVKTGWTPVLREIKAAGIPVILTDRGIDSPEDLYATFIGSDFVEEGRRAANWLVTNTDGKATIAELQGSVGADPAIDRKKGFEEVISVHPNMKIIKSQSGDFTRSGGKQVMEAFLKSPEASQITALYAHNDDMALGAIQAIEEAGRNPGKDLLIVSIDGVRGAFEAMAQGKLNCTVECNPLLGPQLYDTVEAISAGKSVPKRILTQEGVFTQQQAAAELPKRQY